MYAGPGESQPLCLRKGPTTMGILSATLLVDGRMGEVGMFFGDFVDVRGRFG
eukprot:CAMPEP_0170181764 /NCGR_PEP_ID=MMETSP0040_2-20121228/25961_1 /TAXON_ID=641309 /ORGANISM="Lotharella oceanica, Strain CCMP622" /LENGTH=51 /DNA_ID=CAMNT_0010426931 /DNA_START=428 /DNA_END=580 /DNA_ORIENTATION=+